MRNATRIDYKKSIFSHLNVKPFIVAKATFQHWLEQQMKSGMFVPEKFLQEAETFLIANKIVLPTVYYLKREIHSFCSQQQEQIFTVIYQQLHEESTNLIDKTLEIISGKDITWFQKFKEYLDFTSISILQDYLQLYKKINQINVSAVAINIVPPDLAKYFYQLTKHYDAFRVNRLKLPKRYALMLLFLNESKKVIIAYIIQLHDQYISNV